MKFRNRSALFVWSFAAVWLSLLVAFTFVAVRDGPPKDYSSVTTAIVLGFFWLGGLILAYFATTKPCYFAALAPGAVLTLIWRYPFKRIEKKFPASHMEAPTVVEEKDSEGDPYFFVRLLLPDGGTFDIAEGHNRGRCELACKKFTETLNLMQKTPATPDSGLST